MNIGQQLLSKKIKVDHNCMKHRPYDKGDWFMCPVCHAEFILVKDGPGQHWEEKVIENNG